MKILYLFFSLLILPVISLAQFSRPCLKNGILFTNQNQIDSFPINYPRCTKILDFVRIRGDDITNLEGLSGISEIQGALIIENENSLTDLSGLGNLVSIGSDFYIGYVPGDNITLTSLKGIESLTEIGSKFQIVTNLALKDLSGLINLKRIGNDCKFYGNFNLLDFSGLDNLDSIFGKLIIQHCNAMENLHGLESLKYLNGDLIIGGNLKLSSLENLSGLTSVHGELAIEYNDALMDLYGLENIDMDLIQKLILRQNYNLEICSLENICDYLSGPNKITEIYNNGQGCLNRYVVETNCQLVNIENTVFSNQIKCFPSPFTTSTTIEYTLSQSTEVTISFFNQFGKQVDLIQQKQQQGKQQVVWNAKGLPAGIYFFRLQAGDHLSKGKIVKID